MGLFDFFKNKKPENDLETVFDLINQVSEKHNLWKEHYSNSQ